MRSDILDVLDMPEAQQGRNRFVMGLGGATFSTFNGTSANCSVIARKTSFAERVQ